MVSDTLITGILVIPAVIVVIAFAFVWSGARRRGLKDFLQYLAGNMEAALPLVVASFVAYWSF